MPTPRVSETISASEGMFKPRVHLAVRLPRPHMTGVATVLIIGASRGIGFETVKAALEAGHSVRALARSARRIPVDHLSLLKIISGRSNDAIQTGLAS